MSFAKLPGDVTTPIGYRNAPFFQQRIKKLYHMPPTQNCKSDDEDDGERLDDGTDDHTRSGDRYVDKAPCTC